MFDEFRGLPVHALVVHAAVVFAPLAALLGAAFVMPALRARLRWPLLAVTLAALASVIVARLSGQELKESLNLEGSPAAPLVDRHQDLAQQLLYLMVGFTVLVVFAVAVTGRPASGTRSAGLARGRTQLAQSVLALLIMITGVAVTVQTIRTGELGTRAVWNTTGD